LKSDEGKDGKRSIATPGWRWTFRKAPVGGKRTLISFAISLGRGGGKSEDINEKEGDELIGAREQGKDTRGWDAEEKDGGNAGGSSNSSIRKRLGERRKKRLQVDWGVRGNGLHTARWMLRCRRYRERGETGDLLLRRPQGAQEIARKVKLR